MGYESYSGHPDHDACGTGFVVQMGSPASHAVVDRALLALQRLAHRGGVDADGRSGDGAGLLTEIPWRFMRSQAELLGIKLPGTFGLGMLFLSPGLESPARALIETRAGEMGLRILGWRRVPVNESVLGARALDTLPVIWQCFLEEQSTAKDAAKENQAKEEPGKPEEQEAISAGNSDNLESLLFLFRKRVESEPAGAAYFCSLSSRTVVYKGLLSPWQLPVFYPDLHRRTFESRFAVFHQRFSTNTQPSWSLAQPFRMLAHNGELNTITGNRRWMRAREPEVRRELGAGEWFRCLEDNVSDSASLDNTLELMVRRGYSAEAALLTLVPPAFEQDSRVDPSARAWLESAALEYEPWDGPAALVFGDGRVVGAKLDRNGLRPLRYTRTADGWLVAGSEVGITDFEDRHIVERQRLGPGEMLVVDLASGAMFRNGELPARIAADPDAVPASAALSALQFGKLVRLSSSGENEGPGVSDARSLAVAMGWSDDQLRLLLHPLAEGKEAIWSMGDDTPPAFMSAYRPRRTLWDYCKQRFAQVTNPAIDPLREAHVMSMETRIGNFIFDQPVLNEQRLPFLQEQPGHCVTIDATFPASEGLSGYFMALENVGKQAQFGNGENIPWLVVLSDRASGSERAALPMLLATARVWNRMVESGAWRVPLIVETAQVIDTHHTAMLLAVGATAVVPYLAMHLANDHRAGGAANYSAAVRGGLKKVLSRMGVSSLASYRNGQLFETVGLDEQICAEFFPCAAHFAEATSLEEILGDYFHNHALAFGEAAKGLKDAGLYRFRKDGELHGTSPDLLRKLHAHVKIARVKTEEPESYRQFEELAGGREPLAIRDRLKLVADARRKNLSVGPEEVGSEVEILRRFSSQAMSLGAISPEAHRTLAVAMNRLGARSNTGEGGEDPELYRKEPEAACKTRQVASGRFGVTAEYLVNAEEIEIKMAQGSKPGEGGQLPANKVTAYIARLRHAVPGMQLISPPPHHDIYSIEDLEQLIHDLREVNPQARIGVKLVAGAGIGVIAAGVAKAGADVITISGYDGGTGASSLSSIKNTGLPWEFGLRDVHKTLTRAGLRRQVRLRVDGGLKFARDVVIAACLGADEFGFGTAALLAIGCVMARQCHLNTCPAGIATQDETLRARFTGRPEMVMAYFQGLAAEVRVQLASVGARSLEEINGRTDLLQPRDPGSCAWVEDLLQPVSPAASFDRMAIRPGWLVRQLSLALDRDDDDMALLLRSRFPITNADRSVGARLSGDTVRQFGSQIPGGQPLEFYFKGTAGQSFGAFLVGGFEFHLSGAANDYVGKGLCGGTIGISAGRQAAVRGDILAGNTILYGATSGEVYIAGAAGERFAVRNSGALAVVEGIGDHGCEYMTGGVVILLGHTGINLGSGMTGGLAYILDDRNAEPAWNAEFVCAVECTPEEDLMLRQVLRKHHELTDSPMAATLLETVLPLPMKRLQPRQLPCTIAQTWEPILRRVGMPADTQQAALSKQHSALSETAFSLNPQLSA